MKVGVCAIFLGTLVVAGCTTALKRERVQVGQHPSEPGLQYFLPKQQFTVTSTFRLESCPDANGSDEAKARKLVVKQTVGVVEASIRDSTEFYSIPLSAMAARWKTTTFSGALFPNQVLRSVGIAADDRTGAIAKGVLGTAASIARVIVGSPIGADRSSLCNPETYQALETVRLGRTKLLDPTLDDKARSAIVAAVLSAKAELEITKTYVFEPTRTSLAQTQTLGNEVVKWFAHPELIGYIEGDRAAYTRSITTGIRIDDAQQVSPSVPESLKDRGIIYRAPLPVTVKVCAGDCGDKRSDVLATLDTQVAQLGQYAVIPMENEPFQKNNLSVVFLQNGQLESVTYGTESSLEKLASSAAESATTTEGFLARKKAAEEAAEDKASGAELKAIKDETELLKAKADRIEQTARLLNLSGGG